MANYKKKMARRRIMAMVVAVLLVLALVLGTVAPFFANVQAPVYMACASAF